jgi:sugar/nucleoside kinase (ribokinase family)
MALDLVTVGAVCADVMVRPVETFPPRGQLALVPTLEMHVGGLAGVTAAIFCQLGGRAAFVGRVGADSFGDYIVSTLQQAGVEVGGVRRDPDHRSSASIVMVSGDGERTFLHHLGTNATTSPEDLDLEQISQAKVLHWGGPSLCPLLDGAPIARVFEQARKRGVKTSMDTCYDGKGVWLPLIEPSLPHLDIVFSSLEEARKFTGQQEPEDIADFYLNYGVQITVIKLGDQGMFIKSASGETHRQPAHAVDVVDTTGAGDAACGGFLYGYTQGWDLKRCGRLANAVGGLTVQRMGGAEAIRSLEATLAFMESEACVA